MSHHFYNLAVLRTVRPLGVPPQELLSCRHEDIGPFPLFILRHPSLLWPPENPSKSANPIFCNPFNLNGGSNQIQPNQTKKNIFALSAPRSSILVFMGFFCLISVPLRLCGWMLPRFHGLLAAQFVSSCLRVRSARLIFLGFCTGLQKSSSPRLPTTSLCDGICAVAA